MNVIELDELVFSAGFTLHGEQEMSPPRGLHSESRRKVICFWSSYNLNQLKFLKSLFANNLLHYFSCFVCQVEYQVLQQFLSYGIGRQVFGIKTI